MITVSVFSTEGFEDNSSQVCKTFAVWEPSIGDGACVCVCCVFAIIMMLVVSNSLCQSFHDVAFWALWDLNHEFRLVFSAALPQLDQGQSPTC
eukprot:5251366-Amphidinium_carterae.2